LPSPSPITTSIFCFFQEKPLPFANYKFPEGVVDAARKEDIIHRTTAMFVEYFGEGVRPHSMVLIEEVADGGWGRADETLTTEKMGIARPAAAAPASTQGVAE